MTTPLRAKYIRDLAIRGRAERTQQSYSRYVSELARYYHRSPELISYQEVADWLYYLIKERELSASSVNIAVNAVRFLYGVTLERNTDQLMASVPRMKHAIRRAEIYARSEVEAIFERAAAAARPGVFNGGLCLRTATGRSKAFEDR
jgi:integrase/recombinase XerD